MILIMGAAGFIDDVLPRLGLTLSSLATSVGLIFSPKSSSGSFTPSDLAEYIDALNKNVDVTYSPTRSRGDPEAINTQRFTDEFDCNPSH